MEREIKRDHYLEQLIVRKHNGLIKIITGGAASMASNEFKDVSLYASNVVTSGAESMLEDVDENGNPVQTSQTNTQTTDRTNVAKTDVAKREPEKAEVL